MDNWMTIALDPKTGLRTVAALLVAKIVLAVLRALKGGTFDWRSVPGFLVSDVLPYGGGLAVLWVTSLVDAALAPLFTASAAAVTIMLLRQCWEHVKVLFGADPPNT